MTVIEPPRLEVAGPGQFRIRSWPGMAFEVQSSPDLENWQAVATLTNVVGTLDYREVEAPRSCARSYRARAR